MTVEGVDDTILVKLLDVAVESQIEGTFQGWDGDTIFELTNGQIWQQAGPGVVVRVAVNPEAIIFRHPVFLELWVEGGADSVQVVQLR
jgi:hypothetical protein